MNLQQNYQEKNFIPPSHEAALATVQEILTITEKKTGKRSKDLVVLDVGSGRGLYTKIFAKFVKRVVGVEPYFAAYLTSLKLEKKDRVIFHNVLIEDLNSNDRFDVVACLTILEHMPNQKKSLQKIYSLMKKNSIMYLTAPNKLWPYENHYGLPLLSWLPLPLANFYMRITGKGKSYQDSSYSRTYFGLINLLSKYNWDFEFFIPDSHAPYLGCGYNSSKSFYAVIKTIGIYLIRKIPFFWIFSKGFIVIVHKK